MMKVINLSDNELPTYGTDGASGMDLRAFVDTPITLKPLGRCIVPTGLYIEIPKGYEGQIRGRSGLAIKNGITMANGVGTIDSDYRGEVGVIVINLGTQDFVINNGDRIAQLVVAKHEVVEWEQSNQLEETNRGEGGFGSTGK